MHLSKLEIFGFKSFANKTLVNFTKGITGIVGPNGCGKTNIVDAIRWCLGEQKSSTLRSDKMENVIFNGTQNKKPMGMSEVSLTIVNDRGLLPTDFSEVTITRRIFRSGESEYLLNKNICRLKDITNLFMDTGMGTNAYSVIELKMIETILSNKADERRKMFEEAAGVNKYKHRRRLSLNKLDDVKKDLTRVNDIISEVEKTVRSLERQAKKADKYNKVQTELKEKELGLSEREFLKFNTQLDSFKLKNGSLTNEKNEIDTNIKEIEKQLFTFRTEISEIETEYRNKSQRFNELNDKSHNIQKNISVSEERQKSLSNNISRFENNIEEYQEQQEEAEQNIIDFNSDIEKLNNTIFEKENEVTQKEELLNKRKEELNKKRQVFKEKNSAYNSAQQNISALSMELNNYKKQKDTATETLTKLDNNIQKLTSTIAKSVGYLEDLENEKKQIEIKFQEAENNYTKNAELKEKLETELNKLRVRESEEKNTILNIRDKIELLQTLLTNLEGVSKGAKSLLESNGWTENEKVMLADIGLPKEEYRLLIENVLKNILDNLVIQSKNDLLNAINYLKKNELGKAAFIFNRYSYTKLNFSDRIGNYLHKKKVRKLEKESGFINWAINFIETESKWHPFFEQYLKNIAVVDNTETALNLSSKYQNFHFITLECDFIKNNGIVESGFSTQKEDSLFGRKKLLDELKDELPALENNLISLRAEIENKEKEISKINLKVLSEQGKILLNEINNIDKQYSQMEYEKAKSEQDIEKIRSEIQGIVNEINSSEQNIISLNKNFTLRTSEVEIIKTELFDFENSLQDEENSFSELNAEFNNSKIELERIKGTRNNKKDLLKKSYETKESLSNSISRLKTEIEKSHFEIKSIVELIENGREEHDEVTGEKNILSDKIKEIENQLNSKKNESHEYEEKLNQIRNSRQTISDSIHELNIKQKEISIRLENLINHIQEEYNFELQLKEFHDIDDFDFKFVSDEVHRLREQIKRLGPINLLAYSEYEEENERLQFLLKQRDDLINSERDLIKTIKEINESAETVFLQTFEEIRSNFKNIFQTLFNPGDEADLLLEQDADPLEAKIEIIAKPKGKRPTGIELLSGGEKTLTATALLFAIYLVKPSPFCIMDEVDAPLDDANIDRFTRLLKEFSDNTQFIIVTHNKRTMEAAENMYGVTIQEEGISKLVGVQFNEELDVVV
ncbi:MAG: chromosome segregation protein SMC [Ignavibacteriae bacterium]|nr:MAG: chromosome segregation protein SMC [Ignavibacteriota bacterium]